MKAKQTADYFKFALTTQGKQINITPATKQRQIQRSQHTHDLIT